MIGDEMGTNGRQPGAEVQRLTGETLEADIPLGPDRRRGQGALHLYYIIPGGASYGADQQVLQFWQNLVGAAT